MKKLLGQLITPVLLLMITNAFSQTATITQVPNGTVKVNTAASDGVTPAEYIFTVTNIAVPDPMNPPTIFIEARIGGALVANRLPRVDPSDTANVTDNMDGTYDAQFTYTKLNNFGTINFDDVIDITMGVSGVSAAPAQVTVESAPAVQINIDSVAAIPTVERGSAFTVNFNYSSNVDITSLQINMWAVTFTPYSDLFLVNSAYITNLTNTGGVSTAATATITFPMATEVVNGGGTTWMLNSPITADNSAANVLYQFRFRLDDASGPTGQTFTSSGGGQQAFNFIDVQAVTNDADADGINTFAVDGSNLDICPNTPLAQHGTIDTDTMSATYGCSEEERNALSVTEFDKSINGLFSPNPTRSQLLFDESVETEMYRVMNLTGAVVKEVKAEERTLNVSDLTSGLYFIITDSGFAKFVKQ